MKKGPLSRYSIVLLGLIASVAAYFAGSNFGSKHSAENESDRLGEASLNSSGITLNQAKRLESSGLSAEECIQKIESIYETRDVFRVHLETGLAAKELAGSEFAAVMNGVLGRTGDQWFVIKLIILLEWARMNPDAMLNYVDTKVRDYRLVAGLFQYWADADLASVLNSVGKLGDYAKGAAVAGLEGLNIEFINQELLERGLGRRSHDQEKNRKNLEAALADRMYVENIDGFANLLLRAHYNDPKKALDIALSVSNERIRKKLLGVVARMRWADIGEGLNTMGTLYGSGQIASRNDYLKLLSNIVSSVGPRQFQETLDWLSGNLQGTDLTNVVKLAQQRGFGSSNPRQLLESTIFGDIPDSIEKRNMISNLVQNWAHQDWQAAVEWLDTVPPYTDTTHLRGNMIGTIFQQSGPEPAIQFFDQLSPSDQQIGIDNLASSWGRQDPLGFVSWALGLESPELWEKALSRVGNRWAEVDIEGARYFSDSLPEGNMKHEFQRSIGRRLTVADPIQAIEYASGIQDTNTARNVENTALARWAKAEPKAAMDYLREVYVADEMRLMHGAMSVANAWGGRDPEEAINYFQNLDSDLAQREASVAVVNQWANQDLASAVKFVMEEANENTRDHVLRGLANHHRLLQSDPEEAIRVAQSIRDVEMRRQTLLQVERRLKRSHPSLSGEVIVR